MQNNSIVKRNVLKFIDYKGVNKATFYKQTGVSRSVLDKNGGMSEENIAKVIACYPEINIVWLITGLGEMLKSKYQSLDSLVLENNKLKSRISELNLTVKVLSETLDSREDIKLQLSTLKSRLNEIKGKMDLWNEDTKVRQTSA